MNFSPLSSLPSLISLASIPAKSCKSRSSVPKAAVFKTLGLRELQRNPILLAFSYCLPVNTFVMFAFAMVGFFGSKFPQAAVTESKEWKGRKTVDA